MVYKSSSERDTQKIAAQLAVNLTSGQVVAFVGDLGAGKTTFIRYLAEALGFTGRVQSPTFVVHRIYDIPNRSIKRAHHLDLYRFDEKEQLDSLGLNDIFSDKDAVTFIEWPQISSHILPESTVFVTIKILSENEREISYEL